MHINNQSLTWDVVHCSVALEVGGRNPALIPTVTTRVLKHSINPLTRDLLPKFQGNFFFLFITSFKTLYGTSANTFNPLCNMIYNMFINHSLKDKGNRQNIFPFDFTKSFKRFCQLKTSFGTYWVIAFEPL